MKTSPSAIDPNRKLFFGLFIFPLIIAVGMAIFLCAVVFMTSEVETPETLIASIKSGIKGKRWQKAFELSNELNLRPGAATPAILKEVLHIFNPSNGYDSKTRAYMALALGRFKDSQSVTALENGLADEDLDIRLYCLWSLGKIQSMASAPKITPLLRNENSETRKTAAYVLGAIGSIESVPLLTESLTDDSSDVRWNAALALTRLGSDAGKITLRSMLDRKALQEELKMGETQIESAILNAIKGLVLIRDAESITILKSIAKEDRNLKIRQAAIDALKVFENV